jgi:hypothetical protein
MHARHGLTLLLPVLLCAAAFAALAGVAPPPAVAGMATGNITDKYDTPLGGILVEALDSVTGAQLAAATTSPGQGDFHFELEPPENGMYKVRVSDPAGIFTTAYLYGSSTFEGADLIGYT